VSELLTLPKEFLGNAVSTDEVGNITDQLYYRLISAYGSQADLQRLEKAPGISSGPFLTVDARSKVEKDIERLIASRHAGESLTSKINTNTTTPYVRLKTISSILGIKSKTGIVDTAVEKVATTIGEALDINNMLTIAKDCKNLSGSTQMSKFSSDVFTLLAKYLSKLDSSGNLSAFFSQSAMPDEITASEPTSETNKKLDDLEAALTIAKNANLDARKALGTFNTENKNNKDQTEFDAKYKELSNAVSASAEKMVEISDELKSIKATMPEAKSTTYGSAISSNPGVISTLKKTKDSIDALNEDDIAKFVSALSTNTQLLKYAESRQTDVKLTEDVKTEFIELLGDMKAVIASNSDNAENLNSHINSFEKSLESNDVSVLEVYRLINLIESKPELQNNIDINTHIVEIQNLLNLPNDSQVANTTAQQYMGVKNAINSLLVHRKHDDVFNNKLRNAGFDLILHDFDSFVKQIDDIQVDFYSDDERAEYIKAKTKAAAPTTEDQVKDHINTANIQANAKKEEDAAVAKVLLPGSSLSGLGYATTKDELRKQFYLNMIEFQRNAKIVYSMLKELVEHNPKLKEYLSAGSGVEDIDTSSEEEDATPEQQKAFTKFNQSLMQKQMAALSKGGSGEKVEPSSKLYDEFGLEPEFKEHVLGRYSKAKKATIDTSGTEFLKAVYEIFSPVIATFQRRLSTRPSELSSELTPREAKDITKSGGVPSAKLSKKEDTLESELTTKDAETLSTRSSSGFGIDFPDAAAVNAIRRTPNDKLKELIGEFFPDKSEKDLIKLKSEVVPEDALLDSWKRNKANNDLAELENARIKEENPDLSDKELKDLLMDVIKLGEEPKPISAPILKNLLPEIDLDRLKDKLREETRQRKIIALPAFKTFASVLQRAIDSGDILNPVRVEPQSSAASLDQRASAFLNLASCLVQFKDINNFLLGSIGRSGNVVDTLFDSTSYPATVTQDRNVVLCTRLYIIRQVLEAAKVSNLEAAFGSATIHFCDDDELNKKAQATFNSEVARPIIDAFSENGSLAKEYKQTLELLKVSIKGSNNVVPILANSGDLLGKTLVNPNDAEQLVSIIASRGRVAVNLMRESEKTSDGVKPLLRLLMDNDGIKKLSARLLNCIKIISSGINYTIGREVVKELAKATENDEMTMVA
jgi:hypothetical protein